MSECRYDVDEFCVNDQCPMRGDYCPVPDIEGVCKYEDRTITLTPKGCALAALLGADAAMSEEQFEMFWKEFYRLMVRDGHVKEESADV